MLDVGKPSVRMEDAHGVSKSDVECGQTFSEGEKRGAELFDIVRKTRRGRFVRFLSRVLHGRPLNWSGYHSLLGQTPNLELQKLRTPTKWDPPSKSVTRVLLITRCYAKFLLRLKLSVFKSILS